MHSNNKKEQLPALQVQSPEFKPQSPLKRKNNQPRRYHNLGLIQNNIELEFIKKIQEIK
jgi:hypothetical protein